MVALLLQSRLREKILEHLGSLGIGSANDILDAINESGSAYSLQAIYKELKTLCADKAIVKTGKFYHLSLGWVLGLQEFLDRAHEQLFTASRIRSYIPDIKKKRKWRFPTLFHADQLWMHLVVQILKECEQRILFQYIPHPWHDLLHSNDSGRYESSLRYLGAKQYIIVGGKTFLDRYVASQWAPDIVTYSHAEAPPEIKKYAYLTVVDTFVITSTYQVALLNDLDRLYKRTERLSDLKETDVAELFYKKVTATMEIDNNPDKAGVIRRRFKRYFGK